MNIKIEVTTDYVYDKVTFADIGEYVEINHEGHAFVIRKSELRKVAVLLCEED